VQHTPQVRARGRVVALATVVALFAGACSSDDPGSSADSAPGPSSVPTTEPPVSSTTALSVGPATSTTIDPSTTSSPSTDAPTTTTVAVPPGPLTVQELLDLGRPIVLAHAAGEDEFPHSSPYGYARAAAAGVDMLDFDVQLTGDGVLVVQHDDSTAESTYDQLHALDNAYWFTADCVCTDAPPEAYVYRGVRTGAVAPPPGSTPDDFAIARFRDVAARFADLPVNIEIKGEGAAGIAAAQQLATELTDLDLLDNAVVASFDDAVVTAFHGFAPDVEISPGLAASTEWVLNGTPLPDGMRILQLPPMFGDIEVLSAETMEKSHAAGYVVWVWPNDRSLENADGYRSLLERGMDGLNINFPQLGVDAVLAFTAG
jgi:glycerophosphoryl diester phosphodiesterase